MSERHIKLLRVHALHLRLNDDERELLDALARTLKTTITVVVCNAIREYALRRKIGPTEPEK